MSQTITVYFTAHTGQITTVNAKIGKSLMRAAATNNLDGIAADCGGLMRCATCHVLVDAAFALKLAPPVAEELAMLAFTASPRQPNSRLSCQIFLSATFEGLAITLPATQY